MTKVTIDREERYTVIKHKDLTADDRAELDQYIQARHIPTRKCLVIEADWPEYEPVWQMIEARMARAAPRQPEGEGLEVVGLQWLDTGHYRKKPPKYGYNPYDWNELCRLSDHQRAIAELREECEHLKACQENDMLHMTGLVAERDTLRQQLAERDAENERLRVKLMTIASAEPGRHNIEWAKAMAATGNNEAYAKWREAFDQRDKLAGLLADVKADYTHAIHWEDLHATMKRIDAALAEVGK